MTTGRTTVHGTTVPQLSKMNRGPLADQPAPTSERGSHVGHRLAGPVRRHFHGPGIHTSGSPSKFKSLSSAGTDLWLGRCAWLGLDHSSGTFLIAPVPN